MLSMRGVLLLMNLFLPMHSNVTFESVFSFSHGRINFSSRFWVLVIVCIWCITTWHRDKSEVQKEWITLLVFWPLNKTQNSSALRQKSESPQTWVCVPLLHTEFLPPPQNLLIQEVSGQIGWVKCGSPMGEGNWWKLSPTPPKCHVFCSY